MSLSPFPKVSAIFPAIISVLPNSPSTRSDHSQLSGAGKTLEFLIKEKLGVKVRSIEVNVLQRCAAHLASATDLMESAALGRKAVSLSEEGITGSMVTINRVSNDPYAVEYGCAEIRSIANEAKSVPREWTTLPEMM